jgi:two-component sensor histidine kinase
VVEIIAAGRDVTARRRGERARDVLFRISEAAHSADSLEHLYRSLHEAVADLIDAPNFCIALLDPERQLVEFAYWSDQGDPPHAERPLEHGLTEYVLRHGRPLLAGPEELEELIRLGVARPDGCAPRYWLGVPLESEAGVFGVLAIFSYTEAPGDMRETGELLRFVSQQVADAIRRREAAEARTARARQLEALRRVGFELAAELDLGTLLNSITDLATRLLEGDAGELWLLKGSRSRLERAVPAPGDGGDAGETPSFVEGLVARVWTRGEAMVERRADGSADVVAPIRLGAELLGVLHVHQPHPHGGRQSDVEVLGLFGIQAAIALRNARLFDQARRHAATREALVHEVNHRVKNNLSSIIGLLYAARKQTDEQARAHYEPIMRDLIGRVHGLEVAHRLLSEAEWSALELSELVRAVIVAVVQSGPPTLSIEARVEDSPLRVVARQVGNVALLVNELATNSLKHALAGRVALRLSARCEPAPGAILLEYRDDGPGYPREVLEGQRAGVGLHLLTSIAERSLRAEVELLNDGGAVARIRLPMAG